MIAHIVGPGAAPGYASWLASLAMFAGVLVAAVWWRVRTRRRAGIALSAAGFVATAALLVAQPSVPIPPGYGIAIASAGESTSPVLVRVCATGSASTAPAVPGSGRLLLLLVDGRQVAEVRSDTVALPMSAGRHQLTAQLITADHRAFVPPVTATAAVTVTGESSVPPAPPCAR